jgi:hypothetical protein
VYFTDIFHFAIGRSSCAEVRGDVARIYKVCNSVSTISLTSLCLPHLSMRIIFRKLVLIASAGMKEENLLIPNISAAFYRRLIKNINEWTDGGKSILLQGKTNPVNLFLSYFSLLRETPHFTVSEQIADVLKVRSALSM